MTGDGRSAPLSGRVVCVGTATEVGKTWVGAAVLTRLRSAGHAVAASKPAQSFDPLDLGPTDSAVLGGASGEAPEAVTPTPLSYPEAVAPPMAAARLARPAPTMDALLARIGPASAVQWIESVGSVRSPLAVDGDSVSLVARTRPALVVLVADAGLGTIGAVRSNLDSLAALGSDPPDTVVHLNRFDPSDRRHSENASWLQTSLDEPVTTTIPGLTDRVIAALRSDAAPHTTSVWERDTNDAL